MDLFFSEGELTNTEIERFVADVNSKRLRFETGGDHRTAAFVALAASKGYAFTIDDVKAHVKARFAAGGIILNARKFDLDFLTADYFCALLQTNGHVFIGKELSFSSEDDSP